MKREQSIRKCARRCAVKQPDDRHRLLRAYRERPGHHRAAEKRNEFTAFHSITSSARASTVGGIFRPSALAVLRLMTRLNRVGCSMGRSAGLTPLRILST